MYDHRPIFQLLCEYSEIEFYKGNHSVHSLMKLSEVLCFGKIGVCCYIT